MNVKEMNVKDVCLKKEYCTQKANVCVSGKTRYRK